MAQAAHTGGEAVAVLAPGVRTKGLSEASMMAPLPAVSITATVSDVEEEQQLVEQQSSPHEATRLRQLLSPRVSLLDHLPPLLGPLGKLCQGLQTAFSSVRAGLPAGKPLDITMPADAFARLDGAVRQLMHQYVAAFKPGQPYDWQQEFFSSLEQCFNRFHYIRHLVDATDDYELILICWGTGQVSRVHNHAQSHCWLTCLLGEVEENQYVQDGEPVPPATSPRASNPNLPGLLSTLTPCPKLKHTNTGVLTVGQTGYINDNTCLHSVGCGPNTPKPGAVTLHLYSPPVRRVKLYEPSDDRVLSRVPGFFTIRGRPT